MTKEVLLTFLKCPAQKKRNDKQFYEIPYALLMNKIFFKNKIE